MDRVMCRLANMSTPDKTEVFECANLKRMRSKVVCGLKKWLQINHCMDLRMTLLQVMDNALPSTLDINVLFQWTPGTSLYVLPHSSQNNFAMGCVLTFWWPEDRLRAAEMWEKEHPGLGVRGTWVGVLFLLISCVLLNSSLHPSWPWVSHCKMRKLSKF